MERWYVLFTKPRHEWIVQGALQARGMETFVPTLWHHGKTGALLGTPFFPRYMFARFDWGATGWSGIQWTPGLRHVVTCDGRPAWLGDAKLRFLRDRLEGIDGDEFLKLKRGDRVRIVRGPFADVDAVFDRHLSGERRVAVLLRILGRETRVTMAAEDVEHLG